MKIRDSGMPEQEMWKKFFNPEGILTILGLNNRVKDMYEIIKESDKIVTF